MAKVRRKRNAQRGTSSDTLIYQLKISIQGLEPQIWRRVQVPGNMSLNTLHDIIQVLFDWEDYHLHEFTIGTTNYGIVTGKEFYEVKDDTRSRLQQVIPQVGGQFLYTYDFGDSWEHLIEVEKTVDADDKTAYPMFLEGEFAAPPEDCGGVWGYANLVEIISDPDHPEHDEMLEWLGDEFDPETFDREAIDRGLAQIRRRRM